MPANERNKKMNRPDFLQKNHTNGQTIVEAFQALPFSEAQEVEKWLLIASVYGSMTWQEDCLLDWVNDNFDI